MHMCAIMYLANTVGLTNIDTIPYISSSATTVTEALSQKLPGCTRNLESVFPNVVSSTYLVSLKSLIVSTSSFLAAVTLSANIFQYTA